MASRTYATTPVREVALGCATDAANAARPPGAPALAADEYWRARLDDLHDSWGATNQPAVLAKALAAFQAAPPAAQGQILGLLGMAAYAALPPADLATALQAVGLANFLKLTADQQNQCFTLAGLGV